MITQAIGNDHAIDPKNVILRNKGPGEITTHSQAESDRRRHRFEQIRTEFSTTERMPKVGDILNF